MTAPDTSNAPDPIPVPPVVPVVPVSEPEPVVAAAAPAVVDAAVEPAHPPVEAPPESTEETAQETVEEDKDAWKRNRSHLDVRPGDSHVPEMALDEASGEMKPTGNMAFFDESGNRLS
jgi:hypothetical protein